MVAAIDYSQVEHQQSTTKVSEEHQLHQTHYSFKAPLKTKRATLPNEEDRSTSVQSGPFLSHCEAHKNGSMEFYPWILQEGRPSLLRNLFTAIPFAKPPDHQWKTIIHHYKTIHLSLHEQYIIVNYDTAQQSAEMATRADDDATVI